MGHTSLQYKELLKSLMPRGKAWNRDEDSGFDQLQHGTADELSRVEGRAEDLTDEMFVESVNELIEEWEEEFGITTDDSLSLAIRIEELKSAYIARGQQDKGYFEDVAEKISYIIHIEEYSPFICGVMASGDACGNNCNFFYWHIRAEIYPDIGGFNYAFDDRAFDSTRLHDVDYVQGMTRNLDLLIETINKIKPGHTTVLYDFYGAGFSRGFDWGFKSQPHHDGSIPLEGYSVGFSKAFNASGHYDGSYLVGGFRSGFNLGFNAYRGGGFKKDAFADGFLKPI